ncbi:MAG: hypothetical protein ACD_73C00141G0004 [uncultured bacterium]|nr:MAG: hypothetical protein ACD_73C00141G0004 [uncultured bacterium]
MASIHTLIQGVDFYYNENGSMVLTKTFLLKRGYCCKSDCTHCPYGYSPSQSKQKNTQQMSPCPLK